MATRGRASERFVIVGNGVAGATAARTLRARDDRASITLVSDESDYFFSRTALMYALRGQLDRRDMEPFARTSWRDLRIDRVRDRVVDLDAAAGHARTTSGATLAFDQLVVATGSVPQQLRAPGLDEGTKGVVHFVSLGDLDACEALVPSTREAVVVGGGLIGIELVECLVHFGVRVTFLVREPWFWPVALCREEGERIGAALRAHGVDVRLDDSLAAVERDADGRVASVVTARGERIAAQLLGVCIGVEPGVEWLRTVSTPPALRRGVVVDATLRTRLDNVWAAGDCAEVSLPGAPPFVETIWYAAKRQGELVGHNLRASTPRAYTPPRFFNSAKLLDVEFTTVGELTRVPEGARSVYRAHPTRPLSQRIVHHAGRVLGFNLLGSRWDHTVLSRWMDEDRPLDWVLDHLSEAAFDPEFTRVPYAQCVVHDLPVTVLGASAPAVPS